MSIKQLALHIRPAGPPTHDLIDLRCCSADDLLDDLHEAAVVADLAIADPPWTHARSHGASRPDDHYNTLDMAAIVETMAVIRAPRLALWHCWPLLGEYLDAVDSAERRFQWSWGRPVTGGAWIKSDPDDAGHFGQGYHWSGCSEPVLVYTYGRAHTDRSAPLRNAWHEAPGAHSRKPVGWQAQWIRRWCPPGGLVLDLYAGLGSVAEAVLVAGEGRRYVGAEIDQERHAQALALLAQVRR